MRRLALLLLLAAACDDGPPAVTVRDQATQIADAACGAAFSCGCDNAFTDDYSDEDTCREGVQERIVDRALDDVGLDFDGECTDRVVEAIRSFSCETVDEAALATDLFAAADQLRECRLFHGSVGAGESCERLRGGLGDSCEQGSFCDEGTCIAVGEGRFEARCESDDECQQAFRCRLADDMQMRCLAQPVVGESCSSSGDCGAGAYCNGAGSCIAVPTAGQACSSIPSQDGRICAPGTACANGVCEAGAAQGQACGVTCAAGLTCEGGFCVAAEAAVCAYEIDAV